MGYIKSCTISSRKASAGRYKGVQYTGIKQVKQISPMRYDYQMRGSTLPTTHCDIFDFSLLA